MNRPWMPLYISDYRADTTRLSTIEHGAYLLLIMEYWRASGLPEDDKQLANITGLTITQWKKMKPVIQGFFHSGWKHKRIDEELAHTAEVSSKRRAAAEEKHRQKHANAGANEDAKAPPFVGAYEHTLHTTQREDKTAQSAGGVNEDEKYAFLGGVIKLSPKHFSSWVKAYPQLDLRGELTARDAWLGSDRAQDADRRNWFVSTSKYLANRNTEMKAKADAQRPVQQRGIAGII